MAQDHQRKDNSCGLQLSSNAQLAATMLECMTLGSFTDNLAIVPHAAAGVIESLHFVNISRL